MNLQQRNNHPNRSIIIKLKVRDIFSINCFIPILALVPKIHPDYTDSNF